MSQPLTTTDDPTLRRLQTLFALAWGLMLTLCITGYTFGQSNHHVYLLDALTLLDRNLLTRDWFTTHTMQYHFLYTWLVAALQWARLMQVGFFTLYIGLAIAMHVSWLSIVRRLGGDERTYLLSVLIYHLSAGGLGLGVYQFLQDGSFLPSNVAAIAALAALALWLRHRLVAAGACVGTAGMFHLNYALILVGIWGLMTLLTIWRERRFKPTRRYVIATAIAMTPCLLNVAIAAGRALSQTSKIPLDEFVLLYVKLRHPHHYDAIGWPISLWLSFLWPIPFAFVALARMPRDVVTQRVRDLLLTTLAIELFATLFAGVWFVSETIVQLSLFRFSIFPKLLTCVLTAWLLVRPGLPQRRWLPTGVAITAIALLLVLRVRNQIPGSIPTPTIGLLVGAGLLCHLFAGYLIAPRAKARSVLVFLVIAGVGLPVCMSYAARQRLGVQMPGEGDVEMIELSDWARSNTPVDALFVVPPDDSIFRLQAQRAAVVGFKHVPQLSGELVEWKRRLDDVLGVEVVSLPTPMYRTLDAMHRRYAELTATHLADVARRYECDYIVAMGPLGSDWQSRLVYTTRDGGYRVYRVPRVPTHQSVSPTPEGRVSAAR